VGPGRISVVEAIRGIAAISVALFHFSVQLDERVRDIFAYGWIGVDVFFVISGFVIPLSLFGRGYSIGHFPKFLLRRLVRLEPPYLVSIVLVLGMWHLSAMAPGSQDGDPNYTWPQIAFHLLYAIPLTHFDWISTVYWSLAYEFVFYIVTGLTFASLIGRPVEWTLLLAAVITALLYLIEAEFDFRVVEFLVGIIIMRIVTGSGRQTRLWLWLLACLAVLFYAAGPWVGAAVALAAAAILWLRAHSFGRWSLFLGSISYSLYLTHTSIGMRIVNLGKDFAAGLPYDIALLLAALAISVGFAFIFARLVEGPSMGASRRIAV
jgi:peptidoglycan/LPS O-acetylase OafA/YrhL